MLRKIALLTMLLVTAGSLSAQKNDNVWLEMSQFHTIMAATFHPAEEGNLSPLKQKADSLFIAAKAWQSSMIPDSYKLKETRTALSALVRQCEEISRAVKAGTTDDKLTPMIAKAHTTFHHIMGECKKEKE